MSSIAILGACFERFAKSVRLLSIDEINEWSETKSVGQYGSSSMPHKTNPILSERICGLSRILRSNSNTAIENIPLWLERDISHSSVERIIWPDSFHIICQIISDTNTILKKLFINQENILEKNNSFEAKSSSHKQMLALQEQGNRDLRLMQIPVSKTIFKQRIKTCKGCNSFDSTLNRCKECGCFLILKAFIKATNCPLDKWEDKND